MFDHANFESHGSMKSYFGGLISCAWSPDGRYIATGGEDDLVTVWSFYDKCVVARGTGHRSWISDINFDPYTCEIPSNEDMNYFYKLDAVQNSAVKRSSVDHSDSTNNNADLKSGLAGPSSNYDTKCNNDLKQSKQKISNKKCRTLRHSHKTSVRLENNAPAFCYRFGSVGQDSQLCLWELDENILFYSRLKTNVPVVSGVDSGDTASPARELTEIQETDTSLNGSVSIINGNDTSSEESSFPSPLRSTSVPNSIHSTTETSSKKKKPSSQWGVIPKFATIGAHDRNNKERKTQHKRNSSLPWLRGSSNQSSSNKKNQELKNSQVVIIHY